MQTIKVDYFKPSGKWYASGDFETRHAWLGDIIREFEDMRRAGEAPGLSTGGKGFFVVIEMNELPHMIKPLETF